MHHVFCASGMLGMNNRRYQASFCFWLGGADARNSRRGAQAAVGFQSISGLRFY